jgi:hypothetical protein
MLYADTCLCYQQLLPPSVVSSTTRVLSSVSRSEDASSSTAWASLAVAGATAVLGGTTALALCEEGGPGYGFQRFVTKQGLADPMTAYQRHALHMQRKENTEVADDEEKAAPSTETPDDEKEESKVSAVQATSPEVKSNIQTFPTEMTASEARLEKEARKAKQHSGGIKIFSGNGNMALALEIVRYLGINLGKATVGRFADGEVNVVINENVRGKDVYVVQPTCPPVNDNIMELLLMVSTLRRASARRITVVIPYYGYARQDRKMQVC